MRAPEFWQVRGPAACLLAPLGAVIAAAGILRRRLTTPERVSVPVICVGNLVVGGAGKTPVVLALVTLLRDLGVTAHVLTRGYGGSLAGPIQVDPAGHDAAQVGDEPLLLAAVGLSAVAAIVQQSNWDLSAHFNHNDIYHVIQAGALFLFYRGSQRLGYADSDAA